MYSPLIKLKTLFFYSFIVALTVQFHVYGQNVKKRAAGPDLEFWLTKGDQSVLFEKQEEVIDFSHSTNNNATIKVDPETSYQSIDGFGFTLTDASSYLLYRLSEENRTKVLQNLFSTKNKGIGVSYLRISIGGSDLSLEPYSYDDLSKGKTDESLEHFSMERDKTKNFLIPLLKEILEINPKIKILGSPWSAPAWMKDNQSTVGGRLQKKFYGVYADYFVKYIQGMEENGIHIDAITPQNEPQHQGNNPSMGMSWQEELDFIKNHLGPKFEEAKIQTDIQIWDHNASNPNYPIHILEDKAAAQYISGSAFHLYNGSVRALSQVHDKFPDKDIYFTEQYTPEGGSFSEGLQWHIKNLIIGATRNWSKNVLEWNLASSPDYDIHTDRGGCDICMGALEIDDQQVSKKLSYYVIATASKFVRPGAVRIKSNIVGNFLNVAFQNLDGSKVLVVLNEGDKNKDFNIRYNGKVAQAHLGIGDVGTYVWY